MSEPNARLLVVDDDVVDRTLVRRLLGGTYEVLEATTGTEGVRIAAEEGVDCALVDYRLPDLDGLEVLRRLVETRIPVVMLTGQGDEQIAVRAMQHGARDYIPKDRLTRESLELAVRRAIESGRLQRRLDEARRELEDFVAVVAHDLRSPVATMISLCESVRETAVDRLDEMEDRFLGSCVDVGEDLVKLVEELGEYTRTGRDDSQFEQVDLGEIARAVVERLSESIRSSDANVEIDDLPVVRGSRAGLSQLLQNLVSNALKFCEGRAPRVEISAERVGNELVVSVADNGIGIPSEHLRSVFAPLKRLHSRDRFAGTGLGLATCSRIVSQHDGRIWATSAPGEGSVFAFALPAKD